MIDELLARLREWRDNRDRAEAHDLKRREQRLWREISAAWDKRDEYERAHEVLERQAYARACEAAGVVVLKSLDWPRYQTADGKVHLGRPEVRVESVPWNVPPAPDAETLREHSIAVMMIAGKTREEAETIQTNEEAENERIRLWAARPGPGLRTVDASCDPRRPVYISEREYNELAGIPGRGEIVALGPA